MRRYYKENFDAMFKYKPRMKEMTDSEMDSMISTYLAQELQLFPKILMRKDLQKWITHSMKIIVLCDWYNKGEWIVQALDLNLIWNLLNKYN